MNNIYDNGTMVLGNVKNMKVYLLENFNLEDEDIYDKELFEFLDTLSDETIIAINYDNGMGYSIDYWNKDSIVKECEQYVYRLL